jgi:hypothetical protein
MFSADYIMNLQVLIFLNDVTLVEYQTRAFKGAEGLERLAIKSACDGFFKLVREKTIYTYKWTMDFGMSLDSIKISANLHNASVNDVKIMVNTEGKVKTSGDTFEVEVHVKGADDARKLALQTFTWLSEKVGIINKN